MTATQPHHSSLQSGRTGSAPSGGKRLIYLCLQQTVEGQASHAHVHEIIAGLERRGWSVDLREISADRSRARGRLYFLWHYLKPQIALWLGRSPQAGAMYVRADALAFPAFLWARLRGIPVVQEVNGPYSDRLVAKPWLRPFGPVLRALQRFQLRRSSGLIAVTPLLAEWLKREAPGNPVTIVPNGANTALFYPEAQTHIRTPDRYVILVGLLARWQGIQLLLAAVNDPAWPSGIAVVIAGDGTERPRVEKAAKNDSRIHYLGIVPYRDVPGLVAGSLAGLSLKTAVPGRTETGMSPLKLYETLACGVPAVVTEYHGQADVVREHDCGIIVSQDDPSELARAVARMAMNESERRAWGRNGRSAVEERHSWDQRAGQTDQLLRSVLR
jgi:glycosyltransferase involved in cell wall biosynthesis